MKWLELRSALNVLAETQALPDGLTQDGVLEALQELGFPRRESLSVEQIRSLTRYTWKGREVGVNAVLGSRLGEFLSFVHRMVEEYGDSVQPTEKSGSKIVGMRRLLLDIISFAYGCMDLGHFYNHVDTAARNGRMYEENPEGEMVYVVSPVDAEVQLPASFPSQFPANLGEFMDGWVLPQLTE